jgi:hypothetical protein
MTGRPAASRIALRRAARSWWRSRSQFELFRWRIAAVAAEQIAGGREDEARRIGADRIDDLGLAGDIAAEAAERLGERAFEHVDAMHDAVAFGDAAAARAVHADRMDLIDIGHGAVLLGEIADFR